MTAAEVQALATCFGALAIVYVAAEKRNSLPRLWFDFEQGSHVFNKTKGRARIELIKEGRIRNLSLSKETISKMGIVVWDKTRKLFTLFDLHADIQVIAGNQETAPPFNLNARETVRITVKAIVKHIDPQALERLTIANFTPSVDMILCFETTDGSWFDEEGRYLDIVSADWRWRRELANLQPWKPINWFKKIFWHIDWALTRSILIHNWRRLKRRLGFL